MRCFAGCLIVLGLVTLRTGAQTITTVAGTGTYGYSGDNGPAAAAQIDTAYGVAVDAQGNVFVADTRNHRVRKISNGVITTAAGNGQAGFSGDGAAGTAAQLNFPRGVAVDGQGNLYIADTGNCRIRKVTQAGIISTVAGTGTAGFAGDGGAPASAQLSYPEALAVDSAGNLYVADSWNYRVREIANGKIQTIAGNGSYGPFGDGGLATAASLGLIQSLALDAGGNLYLSDGYNHLVRRVVPGGNISTVIGGGFGPAVDGGAAQTATLKFPKGIATDSQGDLFVADSLNQRIRVVSSGGVISTIAGTGKAGYSGDGGAAAAAQLNGPYGLGLGPGGILAFSDLWNYRVRSLASVIPPPAPVIVSVSNAAGGQPIIAAGAFVSIYGTNLAPKTDDWGASITNQRLPTQIDGVSVTVGGQPAYIDYISPNQINILTPNVASGTVPVTVTSAGVSSAPFNVPAQPYSPAFFLWGQYAAADHADFSVCAKAGSFPGVSATPAKPGEWIVLWATGFGPTNAPLGSLTPGDKLYPTNPVTVTVGGVDAPVYGGTAVLSPGFAGLYQIGVQIPASTPDGDAVVRATVGGVQSPGGVFLTVQH
jgi:uncharacterized protein (TIGR03437 family)